MIMCGFDGACVGLVAVVAIVVVDMRGRGRDRRSSSDESVCACADWRPQCTSARALSYVCVRVMGSTCGNKYNVYTPTQLHFPKFLMQSFTIDFLCKFVGATSTFVRPHP